MTPERIRDALAASCSRMETRTLLEEIARLELLCGLLGLTQEEIRPMNCCGGGCALHYRERNQ